jgi:hypothetical protein
VDDGSAHLHQFGFNPLFLQFAKNVAKQNGGVSAFPGAAVERDDSHIGHYYLKQTAGM